MITVEVTEKNADLICSITKEMINDIYLARIKNYRFFSLSDYMTYNMSNYCNHKISTLDEYVAFLTQWSRELKLTNCTLYRDSKQSTQIEVDYEDGFIVGRDDLQLIIKNSEHIFGEISCYDEYDDLVNFDLQPNGFRLGCLSLTYTDVYLFKKWL